MSRPLLRPEAAAWLARWREALAGGVVALLGLWWWLSGMTIWIAAAPVLAGLAVVYTGAQRARLRAAEPGPGVVRVDEGRVLYMGPRGGGMAELAALRSVAVDPRARAWLLDGEAPLTIPAGALGADALLDAFAALPGFQARRALAELEGEGTGPVVVWTAPGEGARVGREARPRLPGS